MCGFALFEEKNSESQSLFCGEREDFGMAGKRFLRCLEGCNQIGFVGFWVILHTIGALLS